MVKMLVGVLAVGALAVSLSAGAVAPKDKAAPVCPVCKMTLASAKDDKTPVAIKAGKKTVYCCSGCDMSTWKKDKKGVLLLPKVKK